ncbi:hypothetical protein HPB47_019703 [Ixodes persulcatus]|uniref:Uncharacterized protein n=1 Tax=Ixodes persulcatus TaxID=34615 RepID=A0AC60QHH6_IXOPE|nr:hypothetical protein HPB47_019703 [Ixodes persulcatus]
MLPFGEEYVVAGPRKRRFPLFRSAQPRRPSTCAGRGLHRFALSPLAESPQLDSAETLPPLAAARQRRTPKSLPIDDGKRKAAAMKSGGGPRSTPPLKDSAALEGLREK